METPINEAVESYRQAETRLRQVLFGDGVDTPGLVKGEDLRLRVNRDLRRMRDAFNSAAVADDHTHLQQAEKRLAGLEEELRTLVSAGSGAARDMGRSGPDDCGTDDAGRGSTGPQCECELDLPSGQEG